MLEELFIGQSNIELRRKYYLFEGRSQHGVISQFHHEISEILTIHGPRQISFGPRGPCWGMFWIQPLISLNMRWYSDYKIKPHYTIFQAVSAVSDEKCFYIIPAFHLLITMQIKDPAFHVVCLEDAEVERGESVVVTVPQVFCLSKERSKLEAFLLGWVPRTLKIPNVSIKSTLNSEWVDHKVTLRAGKNDLLPHNGYRVPVLSLGV